MKAWLSRLMLIMVPSVLVLGLSGQAMARTSLSEAREAYRKGRQALVDRKYAKALPRLERAVRLLPVGKKYRQVRLALQYMVAVCKLHLGNPAAAVKGLVDYAQSGNRPAWRKRAALLLQKARSRLPKKAKAVKKATAVRKPAARVGKKRVKATIKTKAPRPEGAGSQKEKASKAVSLRPKRRTAASSRRPPKISLRPRRVPTKPRRPRPAPQRRSITPWIVAGSGVAAMVVGAVFLAAGESAESARDDRRTRALKEGPTPTTTLEILNLHDTAGTRLTTGWVLLGVGALGAGTGLVLALLGRRSRRAEGNVGGRVGGGGMAVVVGADVVGLQYKGVFR